MKRPIFLFIITFALFCIGVNARSDSVGERPNTNITRIIDTYTLDWSDEFSGTRLDEQKWAYRALGPRRDAVVARGTVSLDGNGHLTLTTARRGTEYHTAMISTAGKYETTFGYFECRVKLQTQVGHWSAFWLQAPGIGTELGNPAKQGTEVDIFEYLRKYRDAVQHAIHWDGYGPRHKSRSKVAHVSGLGRGWHTFGLLWTHDAYTFFVDGTTTWHTTEAISKRAQYMILSLEVGTWAGDITRARLPDHLSVDYVRVYKTPRREKNKTVKPSESPDR